MAFFIFNFRIGIVIVNKIEYILIKNYQSQYLKIINYQYKKMAAILLQQCFKLIWEKNKDYDKALWLKEDVYLEDKLKLSNKYKKIKH